MANLTENPQWEDGIYRIETSDPVLGGEDGIANKGIKQLANRTSYLKNEVELRAAIESPSFTGTPTAPTPAQTVNNAQIATTAFVKTAIAALVGSAPAALDTLAEIAAALGSDGNLKQTLLNEIGKKVDKSAFSISKGSTGWANVNGLIFQWSIVEMRSETQEFIYPIAFPNAAINVGITDRTALNLEVYGYGVLEMKKTSLKVRPTKYLQGDSFFILVMGY